MIYTVDSFVLQYVFGSFMSRDNTYKLLLTLLKLSQDTVSMSIHPSATSYWHTVLSYTVNSIQKCRISYDTKRQFCLLIGRTGALENRMQTLTDYDVPVSLSTFCRYKIPESGWEMKQQQLILGMHCYIRLFSSFYRPSNQSDLCAMATVMRMTSHTVLTSAVNLTLLRMSLMKQKKYLRVSILLLPFCSLQNFHHLMKKNLSSMLLGNPLYFLPFAVSQWDSNNLLSCVCFLLWLSHAGYTRWENVIHIQIVAEIVMSMLHFFLWSLLWLLYGYTCWKTVIHIQIVNCSLINAH